MPLKQAFVTEYVPNSADNLGPLEWSFLLIDELVRVDVECVLIDDVVLSSSRHEVSLGPDEGDPYCCKSRQEHVEDILILGQSRRVETKKAYIREVNSASGGTFRTG